MRHRGDVLSSPDTSLVSVLTPVPSPFARPQVLAAPLLRLVLLPQLPLDPYPRALLFSAERPTAPPVVLNSAGKTSRAVPARSVPNFGPCGD